MHSKEIYNRTDHSEPRNQGGFSQEGPGVKAPTTKRIYPGKAIEAAASIGALALSSAAFYRIRELLAAFLLFSVVFCTVAVAFLILWLVERGAHDAAVRLETHMAHISARHNVAPARVRAIHVHRTPPWS
jgi:hypothetical protein